MMTESEFIRMSEELFEHIEDQIADYVLDHPDATNLVAQVDEAGKITVAATQKAIAAPMDAATDAKTEE